MALPLPEDDRPETVRTPRAQPRDREARTFGLAERHESRLLSLFELSHELGVGLDPYGIAQLALFNLMGHFGTPRAALWLLPADAPAVLLRCHGLREGVARALGQGLALPLALRHAKAPGPVRVEDWKELMESPAAGLALENRLTTFTPIAASGRLIGVLAIGERLNGEPFGAIDLDHLGAAGGMIGAALDNTQLYLRILEANRRLRQANEGLQEVDRLKNEFLQNVSHELRTPLAITVGYLDELQSSSGLTESQRRAVQVMTEQSEKLGSLVQNLLDFSAVREGAFRMEVAPLAVAPFLRGYADTRRPGVIQGLREFVLDTPGHLPAVQVDERRLQQVLDALVDNAVKFTPTGTRIAIRAEAVDDDGAWVRIAVEDNGPGIAARTLVTLFEPFRQGDGSLTREVGGMGLGLALVKQIVERMGGRLEVRSQAGEGTAQIVWLQVTPAVPTGAPPSAA